MYRFFPLSSTTAPTFSGLLINEDLSGCYVCPLDDVLGIRKYDRIGDNISAELVTEAAETSHARSAQIMTDGFHIGTCEYAGRMPKEAVEGCFD